MECQEKLIINIKLIEYNNTYYFISKNKKHKYLLF
jgi:hypothetical protein